MERFCYRGFLRNSSGTNFFVRLREVSALDDVRYREVPLYFSQPINFFKRFFLQEASKVNHSSEVKLENTIEGKNYTFATNLCLVGKTYLQFAGKTYMEVGCPYIFATNLRFVEHEICKVVGCPYNTILIHYCTVYAETTSVVP